MSRILSFAIGLGRFWYRFIVGDDWTMAVAVVVGLGASAWLTSRGLSAWWLVPPLVVVMLFVSLRRAKPRARAQHR